MQKKAILVILRHGNTLANKKGIYSGWIDEDISTLGVTQARKAARAIQQRGIQFDSAYCSFLQRSYHTIDIILKELGQNITAIRDWRLNECHCGAYTGKTAVEAKSMFGVSKFTRWRKEYSFPPPLLPLNSPLLPKKSEIYQSIDPNILPRGESLEMGWTRCQPFWHDHILKDLSEGKNVLIVTHGNLLRAIMKEMDGISAEQAMAKLCVNNAVPIQYQFENGHFSNKTIIPIKDITVD